MRKIFALVFVVLLAVAASDASARPTGQIEHLTRVPSTDARDLDIPARAPDSFSRQDTFNFGNFKEVAGEYYAVLGGIWDFEDGADGPGMGGPSTQGWEAFDLTANSGAWWRHITDAIWSADDWNPDHVPTITGAGSAWVGRFGSEARDLCWANAEGPGYGNNWCQRLTSPVFSYTHPGSVNLSLKYWNDTEEEFDFSQIWLLRFSDGERVLLNQDGEIEGFHGKIGFSDPDSLPGGAAAALYERAITANEFGNAATNFQIVFEFVSDPGYSDADGLYTTEYGPFAVDDVILTGSISASQNFDFDDGLQGWAATACPGVGSYFAVGALSQYIIQDPCVCALAGNLVHFHHPTDFDHPFGQWEWAWSPIVDRTEVSNYLDYNRIFADWDQYCEIPIENCIFYRSAWAYYPFLCEATGELGWSPRVGIGTYYYTGENPVCAGRRNIGTNWGLPSDVEQVRFGMEVRYRPEDFGLDPEEDCTGITNATPLFDNFQVRMTGVVDAPAIAFDSGTQFQDIFGAAGPILSPSDAANTVMAYNRRMGTYPATPPKLGDSLVVTGPLVIGTAPKWEAKLWFRVARKGPAQDANPLYNQWKAGVSKGFQIENGQFSYGLMDSVRTTFQGQLAHRFASYFHNNDPSFMWGGGSPDNKAVNENAIMPNLAFTPGTKIEYFLTGDYVETTPPGTYSYLPDTTGAFFLEFEVLPSYRWDDDVMKFPCVLYVDAYNRGAEPFIAPALNVVLNQADWDDPIPDPAPWDKYDYFDASSNWKAPMFRPVGGNNGALLTQLIGYRAIVLNTGTLGAGCMWPADFTMFADWLTYPGCEGNAQLKGFIANGSNIGAIMAQQAPAFMSTYAGIIHLCTSYNDEGCPSGQATDENYCVQLDGAPGSVWIPNPLAPIDLFGNWCPPMISYDLLGTTGGGMGNKVYQQVGTGLTANYAQIVNDQAAGPSNYRFVTDAFSYHLMTMRDVTVSPDPDDQCPVVVEKRVEAAYNEIRQQLMWVLNIGQPHTLGLCTDPCGGDDSSVPGGPGVPGLVNRLDQNHPNPFNPRTTIRFSLAQAGPTQLVIYDVSGRKVRTLVDGHKAAGEHSLVWDGLDDSGRPVASGVFWSQLAVDGFSSNKKMVVLK